jgi:hypothetical protein
VNLHALHALLAKQNSTVTKAVDGVGGLQANDMEASGGRELVEVGLEGLGGLAASAAACSQMASCISPGRSENFLKFMSGD